jgi:hypothetical protein
MSDLIPVATMTFIATYVDKDRIIRPSLRALPGVQRTMMTQAEFDAMQKVTEEVIEDDGA